MHRDRPRRQDRRTAANFSRRSTAIDLVRDWLNEARRIVFLTGAGISTDSGIPDFRGPQGVWTRDPQAEKLSNIHYYVADPEIRRKSWQARLAHPAWTAQPNAGHRAIVELERRGQLHALITQNIDGLHQRAGNSAERVIEVHGTVHAVVCLSCGWKGPMQDTLARVRAGESDPRCEGCGGILKSDTISFGQPLVPEVIASAMQAAGEADLFFSVGTSLQVYPVAGVLPLAKRSGARVVIVNAEATPFDDLADAVLRNSLSETLAKLTWGSDAKA
ncbi:MAG: Sir2 family NAD-dependent protein deacetylase [Betaproteobacteria bacterium]|nr:Sir2 family NAD-dependent protein deacetylase [Betaproteobacteria bacterium]